MSGEIGKIPVPNNQTSVKGATGPIALLAIGGAPFRGRLRGAPDSQPVSRVYVSSSLHASRSRQLFKNRSSKRKHFKDIRFLARTVNVK
jgi:hypothetical protein